ncbi:ABC transporter ATP-binding protein [Acrocarpospora catenulata]|uniref:ABC transporter ATP-binding protein n=1 Tax=Acrocarpospora catenulata TaxID=2836182 RepID=UPI001BDA1B09|nr:ABC transporter ATP-binding protein [Acrocarpospora catenulata]
MTALMELHDVAVHFGGVRAVDGVSLTIGEGSVHGIVGPNGSGKTTLLNAMSGLQPLTAGRIALRGQDVTGLAGHQMSRAGVVRTFQSIRLLPSLTVYENVLLGAEHTRGRRHTAETTAGARAALARLEITHLARRHPDELSYGTRRRVEIARALAGSPALLLLDEPLAGMNRSERTELIDTLRRLGGEGVTQVVIEHDVPMLLDVCDHMFVMSSGRLLAEGHPPDVVADPRVREVYLGRHHDAA